MKCGISLYRASMAYEWSQPRLCVYVHMFLLSPLWMCLCLNMLRQWWFAFIWFTAKVAVQLAKGDIVKSAVLCHPSFVTIEDIQGNDAASMFILYFAYRNYSKLNGYKGKRFILLISWYWWISIQFYYLNSWISIQFSYFKFV